MWVITSRWAAIISEADCNWKCYVQTFWTIQEKAKSHRQEWIIYQDWGKARSENYLLLDNRMNLFSSCHKCVWGKVHFAVPLDYTIKSLKLHTGLPEPGNRAPFPPRGNPLGWRYREPWERDLGLDNVNILLCKSIWSEMQTGVSRDS